jgi:hypothetical protein
MSQRNSGYERKERDSYQTPEWVTDALIPHLPTGPCVVWECAAGSGQMVAALCRAGFDVIASDITDGRDFLSEPAPRPFRGIITNPPYGRGKIARLFIERALSIVPAGGFVAMLLRTDVDHGVTRQHLFSDCAWFWKRVVLTKRIKWFEGPSSPSENHAWFIWAAHSGKPTLAYQRERSAAKQTPPDQTTKEPRRLSLADLRAAARARKGAAA